MTEKEILVTKGFAKSLSNQALDREKVNNILAAKNATVFMEAVNKLGDDLTSKKVKAEAEAVYKEFGFAEYSSTPLPFEKFDEFIMLLKFNIS